MTRKTENKSGHAEPRLRVAALAVALGVAGGAAQAEPVYTWQTVVNNTVQIPGTTRNFNSYNQKGACRRESPHTARTL